MDIYQEDRYLKEKFWAVAPGWMQKPESWGKSKILDSWFCLLFPTGCLWEIPHSAFYSLGHSFGNVAPALCSEVSLAQAYWFSCSAHMTDSKCCKRLDLVWNVNSVYKRFVLWCCLPHYVSNSAWLFSQLSSMRMWNQVSLLAENYERYYCSYPVKPSSYLIVPLPLRS